MILALAIVAGIQSVGVVMTTALMETPAAAASLITRKLQGMFVWWLLSQFRRPCNPFTLVVQSLACNLRGNSINKIFLNISKREA